LAVTPPTGSVLTSPTGAVFLSYASEDAEAAQRICSALRAASVEVWFDQSELRGGDAWDAAIRRQIKSCALFVPIISVHTRARVEAYFRLEWKLAVDRSHLMAAEKPFLVPVVIDDTQEADARVPDRFHEIQWTRLPAGGDTSQFVERIRRLLTPVEQAGSVIGSAAVSKLAAPGGPAVPGGPAAPSSPAAPANPAPQPSYAKRAMFGASALLLAALVYFGVTHRWTTESSQSAPAAIPDKSIAVLPFTDLSEKKDQQYFSDGLSEELIDLLAQIPELKVTARTSSFSFRDRPITVAEIGQALKVVNVLEGSVRKNGNTIRITAQLVRADNGYHLWSGGAHSEPGGAQSFIAGKFCAAKRYRREHRSGPRRISARAGARPGLRARLEWCRLGKISPWSQRL